MNRRLQVRDINDPIARIVREHLNQLNVATIHHGPLIRALQDEMGGVVQRAINEGYDAGLTDAAEEATR